METFFDLIGEVFIKFFSGMPNASDYDLTSHVTNIRTILGYLNYLLPVSEIALIFNTFVVMIGVVTFGFVLVRTVLDSINPLG